MAAGVAADKMSLSSQELPDFFPELIKAGVKLNACRRVKRARGNGNGAA
jgi:predicted peroxiredoxin